MPTRPGLILALALGAGPAFAQGEPLSAIDWLSDSVQTSPPPAQAVPDATGSEPPVANSARPESITVRSLDRTVSDLVGLVPAEERGLDPALWEASSATTLGRQLTELRTPRLPSMQHLLQDMLTVEATPPRDSADGQAFFLDRLDALLALGAFDHARKLMEKAGPEDPRIFRRWFDVTLLTGRENRACARMRALPEITPTYPARIFCLARSGDWPVAVVTLESARSLGVVTAAETDRLTRFLDDMAGGPALPPPPRPSPLDFLILEAIGEPMGTHGLPLAFAHADLRENGGWKARIEAGERLARAGAIPPDRLWEIYAEREPAASGEMWDRVELAQKLEAAIASGKTEAIAGVLPQATAAMKAAGLEVVLAARYGAELAGLALDGDAAEAARTAAILAHSEANLAAPQPPGAVAAILTGGLPEADAADPLEAAVAAGLGAENPPESARTLIEEGRTGEAMLYAIELLEQGAGGNLDAVSDGLAILVGTGQEDRARRAAVELLLLGPMA